MINQMTTCEIIAVIIQNISFSFNVAEAQYEAQLFFAAESA